MSERRGSLDPVRAVRVVRVTADAVRSEADCVAVEEPLEVRLHDRPFVVIMRTPGADRELTAGFLLAEGIIADAGDLGAVEHCRHPDQPDAHHTVNVFLMGDARVRLESTLADRRNVVTNSSCGMCGRVTIASLKTRAEPLTVSGVIDRANIHAFPDALRARQTVFSQTGGLHGAALLAGDGTLVVTAEDVGRHNAVDKVIGAMLLEERLPLSGHVLVVSGRASFEIVQKAWLAGIEMLCAVSAPSSLAIELATEAGMTLLGFARAQAFNIYSHPQRVGEV